MTLVRTAVAAVLLSRGCFAGTLFEFGDAGRDLRTAQVVSGLGPLDAIFGNLTDIFDVDLYQIGIPSPLLFSAITIDLPGINVPDQQLSLFDASGRAIYLNDDDESGMNGSQSFLSPGHPLGPLFGGAHYLGIGWFDNEPLSSGGMMFANVGNGTSGPGPGGRFPLLAWDDNVINRGDLETGYEIRFTGATFVPEPSTTLLTGISVACIVAIRRRGRRGKAFCRRRPTR